LQALKQNAITMAQQIEKGIFYFIFFKKSSNSLNHIEQLNFTPLNMKETFFCLGTHEYPFAGCDFDPNSSLFTTTYDTTFQSG
jgi:hypothetical protein